MNNITARHRYFSFFLHSSSSSHFVLCIVANALGTDVIVLQIPPEQNRQQSIIEILCQKFESSSAQAGATRMVVVCVLLCHVIN